MKSSLQRRLQSQPCLRGDTGLKRKRGDKGDRVIYNRKSAWWKLPCWKDLQLPHNLDVMHIEKNMLQTPWNNAKNGGQDKGYTE